MVGYKLSKNDLVAPFFVIFRSVREKLLVTVFFDHPVQLALNVLSIRRMQKMQIYFWHSPKANIYMHDCM